MKNKGFEYVFYIQSGCTCTLIDCSIDNTEILGSGSLDKSQIGTNSFIYGLTFLSTGDCVNINDTISGVPLTFFIERTPEKTPLFHLSFFQRKIKSYLFFQ